MRFTQLIASIIVAAALVTGGFAQGKGKSKTDQKHEKKHEQTMKRDRIQKQNRKHKDDDFHWERMNRELRLSKSQGQRISAINRNARDRIRRLRERGLRGEDLSRRIRDVHLDARRRIEAILTADQRRRWDWDDHTTRRRDHGG